MYVFWIHNADCRYIILQSNLLPVYTVYEFHYVQSYGVQSSIIVNL